MKSKFLLGLVLAATVAGAEAQTLSPQAFKNGDRIALLGNSITEAGYYGMYLWQYYQLHFPNEKIVVLNGGHGGDVAGQMLTRLQGDILRMNPNVLVLTFGMNDSRYFEYHGNSAEKVRQEAVATSLKSFQTMEQLLKTLPNLTKIMMSSSPYDESKAGNHNKFSGKLQTMRSIAAFQKEAAKVNQWSYVDLLDAMTAINESGQKKDTMFSISGPDRIHPGPGGHLIMAWLFLKAQGLTGKPVADVMIDAKRGKLLKSENSTISNLQTQKGKISFDYLANSLPFPIDSSERMWGNAEKQYEALSLIPFTEDLNREVFQIEGLDKNKLYELKIDGMAIGRWSGTELGNGVNLATIGHTPQYQQAKYIAELNHQYRHFEQKLRSYYWLQYKYFHERNMLFQDDQAALDSISTSKAWGVESKKENYWEARNPVTRALWEKTMQELVDRIYTINKPVSRNVMIIEVQ